MKEVTYAQAVCEALDEEMARDENVILLGEDVGRHGGSFTATTGLFKKYGALRVRDTPISENGFVGMALGAALTGLRPVVEIMFSDFTAVCFDQIINQIAKIRYMSGGQYKVPITIRTPIGGGRSWAAQHSQSLQALFAHIPGLKVVLPSTGAEVKGLLKTAIRDDNPVMFFEHKLEYPKKYSIPKAEYVIPFGQANVVREGKDITVACTSIMTIKTQEVAELLAKEGLSVEVIDCRTVVPLDRATIIRSVKKTGKLLIVDEGYCTCGIGAEVGMSVMEDVFFDLDLPIMRVGAQNYPIPFSPVLEPQILPTSDKITQKIREMVH